MAYDNGVTVYDAGDTCLFSDMQLISQMYGPQVAFLSPGTAVVPLEPGHSVTYTASSYEVSG